ncbi:hypothetical protein OS175_13365 [Marinicella sp. S1101]|uniref:hypothetical protein n=1 Tax=Marinicella marina TaxID=2996016 RepID=UPI002260E252|nr:hypothetical protein [Marinicella marina]MCX7554863.1 hypothetical protein [Marinicella marina]MDJ1141521.1 hypothetical protein [Marinicella marina]
MKKLSLILILIFFVSNSNSQVMGPPIGCGGGNIGFWYTEQAPSIAGGSCQFMYTCEFVGFNLDGSNQYGWVYQGIGCHSGP